MKEQKFVPVQLDNKQVEKPLSYKLHEGDQFQNIKDIDNKLKNIFFTADLRVDEKEKESVLEIFFDRPVNSNFISFQSQGNSYVPKLIKIVDHERVILNSTPTFFLDNFGFADTSSDYYKIIFTHTNPIRLENIKLSNDYNDIYYDKYLKFLSVPGHTYRLYYAPQYSFFNNFIYNLTDQSPKEISAKEISHIANPEFIRDTHIDDFDKDGVPDAKDNCIYETNTDQKDENGNGKGDACDDFDYDGITNNKDNCLNVPNIDQKDTDRDDMGDACDVDGESRWVEKNKWLQWVAFAVLIVVIASIFYLVSTKKD
jgi:hypothetical protein